MYEIDFIMKSTFFVNDLILTKLDWQKEFYVCACLKIAKDGMNPFYYKLSTGLELAQVPRVPSTRRNFEHHLWHPRILRFLMLTGTRRAHSM